METWNIQPRARVCAGCGQPFADGQTYYTLLFDEKPRFRRRDVCEGCWRKDDAAGVRARPEFISRWQGVYEAPPQRPDQVYRETAESLLRKLVEQSDARYQPASYILAIMLERKRVLKVREQFVRDGRRVFVYEHSRSGEVFTITDPELRLDQLEHVQREVTDLLEHGLVSDRAEGQSEMCAVAQPADSADRVVACPEPGAGQSANAGAGTDAAQSKN
ncbi:MAG: hypothetical protein NZ739_00785 [Verrucomicrobiae bacterium]|nr:hypothetical protein [Verrucomicrobiae bacterium]MCX7722885.1 hypothetical protein [Verrucomicrobiae bacterium]MDW7981067.1 hypothetical protein [Verrucomicrobiales bacterium]